MERERERRGTGADPVAGAWEPLGVARGVSVDEEARLLAAVAERAEGVVAVPAATAVPVALPSAPATTAAAARRRARNHAAAAAGHRCATRGWERRRRRGSRWGILRKARI
jgi:hypothetical protein